MITIIPEVDNIRVIARAKEIADKFDAPIASYDNSSHLANDTIIYVNNYGVSVKLPGMEKEKPLFIDFSSAKMQYRQKHSGTRKELIARAVGLKAGESPLILDTTAGLGGDSFILAALGAQMIMLERNPLIHLLLEDALKRASENASLYNIVSRMKLINADSINYLDSMEVRPEIIYMDPMFPEKSKTALNKKEMRLFKKIAGGDSDAWVLLSKALTKARRVVIKRPNKSDYLGNMKPSHSLTGKSCRFDVYITKLSF